MNNAIASEFGQYLRKLLTTRTGFLGLGPTVGEVIVCSIIEHGMQRHQEKGVVKGAEKILSDLDQANQRLI